MADAQIPEKGRSRSVASRIATRILNLCVMVLLTLQTHVVYQTLATTKDETSHRRASALEHKLGQIARMARAKSDQSPDVGKRRYTELVESRAITRRRAAAAATLGLLTRRLGLSAETNGRVQVTRVPHDGLQPQLVSDERGVFHMVYYSGDARAGDLSYVRSTDHGATWSAAIAVNEPGSAIAAGTIRGAQVAVGRNGRVHVAWNGSSKARLRGPLNPDSGKPGEPMLYARLNDAASAFEPQRNLMTSSFGLDGGGSVAADKAGSVYVAWHGIGQQDAKSDLQGETRRQVWVARSQDDGKSFAPENKAWHEPTGACGCCGMKVFADRDGNVTALYRSARESIHRDIYLLRSTDRGNSFKGRLLHEWDINACPMSSMDITESEGRVLAAWETGGQVYWASVTGAGNQKIVPVAAPGESKGRKHPRLARNKKGEILLVWTEGTGWQRGGSLAWQVYDNAGRPTSTNGKIPGVPVWSFAAPIAHPDGRFTVFY
jgi:hypothetical protein